MFILASKSKTRQRLLENAGLNFTSRESGVNERALESQIDLNRVSQDMHTMSLALEKAKKVSALAPDAYIIGADQTLKFENEYLYKPKSKAQLLAQWYKLRGKTHYLCSAVVIVYNQSTVWQYSDRAELTMHTFSDELAQTILYQEGDNLYHSVGGYRLEGPSIRLFERIKGDYFTILGLPLLPLIHQLSVLKVV